MIAEFAKIIVRELDRACSDNAGSILQRKDDSALLSFDWKLIIEEAKQLTPTLYSILQNVFSKYNEL